MCVRDVSESETNVSMSFCSMVCLVSLIFLCIVIHIVIQLKYQPNKSAKSTRVSHHTLLYRYVHAHTQATNTPIDTHSKYIPYTKTQSLRPILHHSLNCKLQSSCTVGYHQQVRIYYRGRIFITFIISFCVSR